MSERTTDCLLGGRRLLAAALVGVFLLACGGMDRHEIRDGGFAANFPGEPSKEIDVVETPAGVGTRATYAWSSFFSQVSYEVAVTDLPVGAGALTKSTGINVWGELGKEGYSGGEVVKGADVTAGNLKGQEAQIVFPDRSKTIHRVFCVGDRVYRVALRTTASDTDLHTDYFNGFAVL
ncbi:MAG: hypothetical protein HYV63_02745 [Candidatus Schekmanbacteria bacterium]|nr:hypothetical protein [Candidatus Schekmanbacteria bacterium]